MARWVRGPARRVGAAVRRGAVPVRGPPSPGHRGTQQGRRGRDRRSCRFRGWSRPGCRTLLDITRRQRCPRRRAGVRRGSCRAPRQAVRPELADRPGTGARALPGPAPTTTASWCPPRCPSLAGVSSLRVGLTGGIGAGKSEVSRRLESYGAVVIDADQVARDVVAPGTPGLAEVVAAFGEAVLTPDGGLDRQRLGEIVFADESLRAKLNAIVHPLVGRRMQELERAAKAAIVVHDIPLLAENHLAGNFDEVVVVDVPPRVQAERLARERRLTPAQAEARMRAQATRKERLAVATIVVDNSGSLAELDRETGDLWAELRRRAKRLAGREADSPAG